MTGSFSPDHSAGSGPWGCEVMVAEALEFQEGLGLTIMAGSAERPRIMTQDDANDED